MQEETVDRDGLVVRDADKQVQRFQGVRGMIDVDAIHIHMPPSPLFTDLLPLIR